MNYTQNDKISQVDNKTLTGEELNQQKKAFCFSNTGQGYQNYHEWVMNIMRRSDKAKIMAGCEPTGHYWFTFAKYLKENDMKLVFVNSYHVKQCNEPDDNSPNKTDRKDPKTIAQLVIEGRYSIPYIPEGIYGGFKRIGAEDINKLRREAKLRAVGMKRAKAPVEAAQNSIVIHGREGAKIELRLLIEY